MPPPAAPLPAAEVHRPVVQMVDEAPPLILDVHPKQGMALESEANELLFGGAAGGGKSHYLRVDSIIWCMQVPGLQAHLFRRLHRELKSNHLEGPHSYYVLLGPLIKRKMVKIVRGEIRFWNGSKIYLNHCQHETDVYSYQGTEMHWLGIDEATHWKQLMYQYLRTRTRKPGLRFFNPEHAKLFPRVRLSANPGGVGHVWVKQAFVKRAMQYMAYKLHRDPEDGNMLRQFIPSRLEDNPSMQTDDPDYEQRLEGAGDPLLVRALKEGDWDVVAGSMFGDVWRRDRHVVPAFPVPQGWDIWRGGDDGFALPLAFYQFAEDPRDKTIYVVDEIYGTGMLPEEAAERVLQQDREMEIRAPNGQLYYLGRVLDGLLDDAAFSKTGLESKKGQKVISRGEAMNDAGCRWAAVGKGAGSRVQGIQHVHKLLAPNALNKDGLPGLRFFDRCYNAIETIPVLMRDVTKPEDIAGHQPDHAFDGVRYGLKRKRPGPKTMKVVGA